MRTIPGAGKGDVVPQPVLRDLVRVLVLSAALAVSIVTSRPAFGDVGDWMADGDVPGVVRYELPADGAVVRPFEPPDTLFGPGHRGVDVDVPVGSTVRAAAAGRVLFVGPVAGTTWVTLGHGDGVVTSYGPIDAARVARDQQVARGDPLGVLAAGGHGDGDVGLHWGARRHHRYVDPLSLLDNGMPRPSLVGPGAWRAAEHAVRPYERWEGARFGGAGYHSSPRATAPGFAVPPNANHLLMVAGLGSSTQTVPIPPEHLGYDSRDVTLLSYAGRAAGVEAAADDPRRDQLPHGPEDTWEGVDAAARHLREQLRAQHEREPGRAVDLIGYSLGGVVIVHYLATYHDAYDRSLPPIGHVVTVASPLRGSDVAALVSDVHSHRVYGRSFAAVYDRLRRSDGAIGQHVHGPPLDAPVIDDLRVGSPLLGELAQSLQDALVEVERGPLAMGTRLLTIGGGTDVVVSAGRARLPDDGSMDDGGVADGGISPVIADHRVLPGGHGRVLQTEAVREVVWRFLAADVVVDSPGHLPVGASRVGGHLTRHLGWRLDASDRRWAALLPPVDGS